jgi:hypothetical protein
MNQSGGSTSGITYFLNTISGSRRRSHHSKKAGSSRRNNRHSKKAGRR